MRMTMKKCFLFLGFVLLFSCNHSKDILCTMEYRMLMVSVKDSASKPVILSHYFVKKTSTGEILDFSEGDTIYRTDGNYIIFTDSKMYMTTTAGAEFEFHGLIGATEVVNEKYVIAHDQCHIRLVSGKTDVVISK